MPDALSRISHCGAMSIIQSESLLQNIRNAQEQDQGVIHLKQLCHTNNGKHGVFPVTDGLLRMNNKLFIPNLLDLRKLLLREAHDGWLAGHAGQNRTFNRLNQWYCWPGIEADVRYYVRTCPICQRVRANNSKTMGLLQPMPIPSRPWQVISMDFIVDLPPSRGYTILMVVVDFFTKQAHFIPAKTPLTTLQVAKIFFKYIFKYHGLPQAIVSDRDSRFTSLFWQELFKTLGTELRLSSSFHPQTDGQTERLNRGIEDYIRCYIQPNQKNWVDLLDTLEFCYNSAVHSATGFTPFRLSTGIEVFTPLAVAETQLPLEATHSGVQNF